MKKNILLAPLLLMALSIHAQQIDKARLDGLMKRAEETHSEAVIVFQNNKLVAERYFGIGKPAQNIESMSCTKSIVGLAVACLLSDHTIDSLDVPVCTYYPEWKQGMKQYITLRHLVNMTSGIQNNPNASVEIYPSRDFVQLALAAELSNKPGEVWSYNNKSLNLLAGVIKKITGKRMDLYIRERLFKPLGITDVGWSLDSSGNPHVMSGCQIRPADFMKIGLLLLNKGRYEGRQVIDAQVMEEVVQPCKQFQAYGMLWWLDYEHAASIVDDDIINALKKAGLDPDFIAKAQQMKGEYASNSDYNTKLQAVFGPAPFNYISQNLGATGLQLRKRSFSGKVSYRADGYLGNFIIVDPATHIVAVRMISHDSFRTDSDNFQDFKDLVLGLAGK